mmetsp:Transcript_20914/g.35020  ORF Transcript_20914/g.35020 Transcript_20914/m.35020 type:complete len:556 (+) Transcript_20914:920-2587(+)
MGYAADKLVAGSEHEEKFADDHVSLSWYYRFLNRWGFLTGNKRPEELDRAKWCTAKNLLKHYDVVAQALLDAGIAVVNPEFDPLLPYDEDLPAEQQPKCQPIFITDPTRIVSFDETSLSVDQTGTSKGSEERIVRDGVEDEGASLATKGDVSMTGVGGSNGAGQSLPPCFIYSGASFRPEWCEGAPTSAIVDPSTGKLRPATFTATKKGGMVHDLGVHYVRNNIQPCFPDISPEKPVVLICDGHGSHLTYELVQYCRDVGFILVLRPPPTSSISQGEDVENFKVLKPKFRVAKCKLITDMVSKGLAPVLKTAHLMGIVCGPWMQAFDQRRCQKGWKEIGVVPFTRVVYWRLKKSEAAKVQKLTVAGMNLDVLRFGKRRECEPAEGDDGEEDGEGEEGDEPQAKKGARFRSTHYWSKGPVTQDETLAILKAEDLEKPKKVADAGQVKERKTQENIVRATRNLALASEALAKLKATDNDVDACRLVVADLSAIIWQLTGEKPKGNRVQLVAQVKLLLPRTTPAATGELVTPTAIASVAVAVAVVSEEASVTRNMDVV